MSNSLNVDTLLPCGEKIKPLLVKSCITDTDLKNLLAKRGVFIGNNHKQNSVPLIAMSILSPKEFEELQEKQKIKEDSLKMRTSNVKCDAKLSLVEMLPNDLIDTNNVNAINDSLEFDSDLSFNINQKNEMAVEYKIKRDDLTKDWASSQSTFEGRVVVKKDEESNKIEFVNEFTSEETKDINNEIIRSVRKHFILNHHINQNDDIEAITSNCFTNEERFRFMLQLVNNSPSGMLQFEGIRNVEIGPIENVSLPTDVQWMAQKVKNMIINGNSLQDIDFIKDNRYHNCLILREIEAKYKFNYSGAKGSCIIEFGFPHYFRKNTSSNEFQATMVFLHLSRENSNVNKKNVTRFLMEEFNALKTEKYKIIKQVNL
jgi:hypothetical protein